MKTPPPPPHLPKNKKNVVVVELGKTYFLALGMGPKSGVREPCISVLQVVHAHSKITFGNATI